MFAHGGKRKLEINEDQVKDLHVKIGELAVVNEFLSRKLNPLGVK
jgi:transposase